MNGVGAIAFVGKSPTAYQHNVLTAINHHREPRFRSNFDLGEISSDYVVEVCNRFSGVGHSVFRFPTSTQEN